MQKKRISYKLIQERLAALEQQQLDDLIEWPLGDQVYTMPNSAFKDLLKQAPAPVLRGILVASGDWDPGEGVEYDPDPERWFLDRIGAIMAMAGIECL